MKLVLFDLGKTLEDGDVLLPGARETLEAIHALRDRDGDGPAALLGLVSDFDMPAEPSDVPKIQQRYHRLLDHLGIRSFFEPVAERVTLSTEVGVFKPDEAVFRTAVTKAGPALNFSDVLFVTENRGHVLAARRLGMAAVHVRGPGQIDGEVDTLTDLVPVVEAFVSGDGERSESVVVVAPSGAAGSAAAAGLTWTVLGDVLVLSGSPAGVQQFVDATGAAPLRRWAVPPHHLHLVTQIGRLFQETHPEVPVIVDKGRYLVVALEPGAGALRDRSGGGCHAVRPLPADAVVFDQRAAAGRHGGGPAVIDRRRAEDLSRAAFEADLAALVGFRTRHSTGTGFLAAVEWVRTALAGHGYATQVQTLPVGAGTTRNLIADRPGGGDERGVVIVTAHLDSVNSRGGPAADAPGADDNASGAAGVLAIGRALAPHTSRHDLRLVLFGGEEQGLFGSRHYVAGLSAGERDRIRAVVNMDMIAGRNTATRTVLLEGAAVSQHVIEALAASAEAHTSLVVQTSLDPFNSDHVPFLDQGIPAVLTIEGADGANVRVHTELDTPESCDVDLALEILRMNVGFVAQVLDAP
ncbi:M20/M25/M40 family metallo-hydrolase [Modestobacter marinus]|uniref:M20/M25/M40 family metallo-hydrolase n=1 Tax=Modestobacter marinus TaxID=477641 RepID=UPI001C940BF5|nr:M20/M25/M40 family metallo-hydrolase [Modestobacter marinus]